MGSFAAIVTVSVPAITEHSIGTTAAVLGFTSTATIAFKPGALASTSYVRSWRKAIDGECSRRVRLRLRVYGAVKDDAGIGKNGRFSVLIPGNNLAAN